MAAQNFMAQVGATLVDNGFSVLPIQPNTKKPGMYQRGCWRDYPKWSRHCERPTTESEINVWSNWPQAGIGIAAGWVTGIDIDVLNPTLAQKIEALAREMLGDTPAVRIGKAPKRLLVYRAAQPFAGFKYPPIEVLGLGQQFIAYGIHPETGKPYEWPVTTLADLAIEDLPVVTEEKAREFATRAYELIPADERPKTLVAGHTARADTIGLPEQRGTFDAVKDALRFIPNDDLDYDSWVRIGMAIKGALGREGQALFELWSASASKNVPQFTTATWNGFKPTRIGAGTIYKLALDNGWVPASELQLNGEISVSVPHPAEGLLRSLETPQVQAPEEVNAAPIPKSKPMPSGWDQAGGILGQMIDLMVSTAKRPQPVLALGASLCALSVLMGRNYRTERNIRPNVYIVGIAESGAGKNHARVVINELFRRANVLQHLGGNKIASGAGLLAAVLREPSILFLNDEFGMFLGAVTDRRRSPRYLTEIMDVLTELYTTSGTTYFGTEYASNQHNNSHRVIHQPCVSLYGTTTRIHFWQALQADNMSDGSLARFLVLISEDDFPDSNPNFGVIDPPQSLIDSLILVHQGGGKSSGNLEDVAGVVAVVPNPRVVPMTAQALDRFKKLDDEIIAKLRLSHGTAQTSILARIEENATKLALIRAVSNDPVDPVIEEADAEWGILIARHCAEQTIVEAKARVSENPIEANHKRALQILRGVGEVGMSRREFTRKTQFMDQLQRARVLGTLKEAGLIEVAAGSSALGRKGEWIKALSLEF
jgi:hypothetical protein